MVRRSGSFVRHPARTVVVSVGCAVFFGAIAGGRALLLPSVPMTWIVDDDGGAGVHFTDIQPALDAAVDGDLVLVNPGTYSAFTLTESLSILGPAGGNATVPVGNAVGIAGEAAVDDLWFRAFNATDCTGTLVLDSILFQAAFPHATLTIQSCADVRVLAADAAPSSGVLPAVVVDGSTVELVSCLLEGARGASGADPDEEGLPGGDALLLQGDSRVYVARSLLTGGDGGDTYSVAGSNAGDGGDGIELQSGAELLLLGRGTDLVQGGDGGDAGGLGVYGYGGDGGHGLRVKSNTSVRHSNVSFKGGAKGDDPNGLSKPGQPIKGGSGGNWNGGGGSITSPSVPDPALERTAAVAAGGTASVKLRTEPGVFSRLFVGSVPIIQSTSGVFVDSLVVKEVSYSLGNAPANGIVNASFPLDPTWTQGTVVYAQAMSIFPGGKIRRTNSVPIVVR